MSKTIDNVKAAFVGESEANRKYLAFAKKAQKEGYPKVAKLFRATAHAETVHAQNHLNVLGAVNSTIDNLGIAIAGEVHEHTNMYPKFIKQAEKEGNQKALRSFVLANNVEKTHEELYKKALKKVVEGEDFDSEEIFVCEICGHTAENKAPGQCPVCGARHESFTRIK